MPQVLGTTKLISGFDPRSVGSCQLWLDAADTGTMNSTPTVTQWNDKSGNGSNVVGTATYSGGTMTFNGAQAFSNTGFVFPSGAYSMFAVYSNTTAPAAGAYMNVVYGNGGYPMLGTYDTGKLVSARSMADNGGGLGQTGIIPNGWATWITGTTLSYDGAYGVATDSSGNVFVTGYYGAACTLYNTGGGTGATLAFAGGTDIFIAKYSSAGSVLWATRIAGTAIEYAYVVATDSSGNVFVTGYYGAALTLYNTGGTTGASLAFTGGNDAFLAKYSSAGSVLWATRITGTTTSSDTGNAVATDSSGNVFVTGFYGAACTLYNTGGGTGATLGFTGGNDVFLAKYSSAGSVLWATRITGTGTSGDVGQGVATDSSGNVFVTGYYGAALTLYNTGGGTGASLAFTGGTDAFLAKYSSAGSVLWATRITGTTTSSDTGQAVATDSSGNVFVTGLYGAACTLYNTDGGTGASLAFAGGGYDAFLAKYSSAGSVLWATQISSINYDYGYAVATDSSGNVFVTGQYWAALTLYNTGGGTGASLALTGGNDAFLAKYSSAGSVLWATRIAGTSSDIGFGVATDSSGNVFVTGYYGAALTLYNVNTTTGATLPFTSGYDVFLAKYSPTGFITGFSGYSGSGYPASSNILVGGTYTPSSFSPFVNGSNVTALAGTTAAATGIFIGGPSNYFNGSLSELLIYASTLSTTQRQAVEGYLTWKWNLRSSFLVSHPLYTTPPFMKAFTPLDITGCQLWMDAADTSTMNSSTTVTSWSDKSGSNNTMVGTATYSGGTMTFNGTNQAFSNTGFVFPNSAYSMFAVYSNTTAPASTAYMNVVYGNGGYPMLGTYDTTKGVTARSVVGNTGAVNLSGGWAAQIAGTTTSGDVGYGVATDSSGNVFATGQYNAALTLYNTGGGTGATLANGGFEDVYLAKYSSAGSVLWATRIAGTGGDSGRGVATDSSGNVFVTGYYEAATVTLYNTGGGTGATLPNTGGFDVFLAKYSSAGSVVWAARIAGTTTSTEQGTGIATDSSGNVYVTGFYTAALTLYNTSGTTGASLAYTGGNDCFLAKYSSAGSVLWATRIAGTTTSGETGRGVATDSNGNVFVTGQYNAALTLYNTGGGTGASLALTGGIDVFLAKYSSAGSVVWAAQIAGAGNDIGYGVATDSSGNVFVTGSYGGALTLYNTGGGTGASLALTGGVLDAFLAKYSSGGNVVWAAQIASTGGEVGYGVATDSSGNVFVTGSYGGALTLYNTGGGTGASLSYTGGSDVFLAKYSSAGSVLWAAQIAGTGGDIGYGVATDSNGNVFVTGVYNAAALTLYNTGGGTGATLTNTGGNDAFLAKYSPNGFILQTVPASSNVLVSGTYTPSTFSPFVNGSNALGILGTTAAATGLFIGGPTNYFNGSLSELLIYAATLTTAQRQQLEGYLAAKWGLKSSLISTQPYKTYSLPMTTTVSSNFTIS